MVVGDDAPDKLAMIGIFVSVVSAAALYAAQPDSELQTSPNNRGEELVILTPNKGPR